MENIRYGDTDAGEEKVVAAAKKPVPTILSAAFPTVTKPKWATAG